MEIWRRARLVYAGGKSGYIRSFLATKTGRGGALLVVSVIDMSSLLVRMLILSHYLGLEELGFTSALAVTYGTIEQITDFSLYRFVLSSPRDQYPDALNAAHGLSISRGAVVGVAAAGLSPLISTFFAVERDWPSFAALSMAIFIRGFNHLGPQVEERNYNYVPQLIMNVTGGAVGLSVLLYFIISGSAHYAFLISILAQFLTVTALSHCVGKGTYRPSFFTERYFGAVKFGAPLMFNGLGLAVSTQGDRFIVGYFLGLPTLGLYNVLVLATYVPMTLALKVMNVVSTAWLFNARDNTLVFQERLNFTTIVSPFMASLYGVAIIILFPNLVPLVFGSKFQAGLPLFAVLAFGAYVRIARTEPITSLLLSAARTRRLAAINLAVTSGLGASIVAVALYPGLTAAAVGRILGEVAALAAGVLLTRDLLAVAFNQYMASTILGLVTLLAAALVSTTFGANLGWPTAILTVFTLTLPMGIWVALRAAANPQFRRRTAARTARFEEGET